MKLATADLRGTQSRWEDPTDDIDEDDETADLEIDGVAVIVAYTWGDNDRALITGVVIGAHVIDADSFAPHVRQRWAREIEGART